MIHADSIYKTFSTKSGDLPVLRGVSLSLGAGESLAIMGPSGCGKSTLLNILGTLEPPTSGTVTVDGGNPFLLSERELARFRNRRIGFVFQDHHLLPQCSVLENVLLPTLANPDHEDRTEQARRLLDRIGLGDRWEHRPAELSGGERQRVALARALIHEPAIVLADEPTGNLDRLTADRVIDALLDLNRGTSRVLITVTHSPHIADRFDRRLELIDGVLSSPQEGVS